MNVAALRQHIRPDRARPRHLHARAATSRTSSRPAPQTQWMVRSPSIRTLGPLKDRVAACLEAGATAAGCEVELAWKPVVYADMLDNEVMVGLYARQQRRARAARSPSPTRSRPWSAAPTWATSATSCPSIHPMIQAAPTGVPIHTPEFAGHAASEPGRRGRGRRRPRAGLDGGRPVAPGGRPRRRPGRVRRHDGGGGPGGPRRSAIEGRGRGVASRPASPGKRRSQ